MLLFSFSPDPAADREREAARWHTERETLELAAAGAATVLGPRHSATRAFARAARRPWIGSPYGTPGWRSNA